MFDSSNQTPSTASGYLARLSAAAQAVNRGDYRAVGNLFDLARGSDVPDGEKLTEAFGLMAVKIEAREYALERALAEVRHRNENLVAAARLQAEFGKFFSGSVVLLCAYSMALGFLRSVMGADLSPSSTASYVMNAGLFAMLFGLMGWFLRSHEYPLSEFGLNPIGWKRAVAESVAATALILPALAALKLWLVLHTSAFAGQKAIDWHYWGPWQMWFIYAPAAFAQELATRGFQQTCIERLLTGKYRTPASVVLTSAQFAMVHLHYSFATGLLAFFGALVFGGLYTRHRTVVGVSVAHYLIGQAVFGPLRLIG